MSWLRLDDGFASHPKIAALSDFELRVWLRVLCYCARLQDPTVDGVAVREVKGLQKRVVRRFEEEGLLDPSGDDYEVHGWAEYQPKDMTNAERQARWRAKRNAERNAARNAANRYVDRDESVTSRAGAHADPSRTSSNPRAVRSETTRASDNGDPFADTNIGTNSPPISLDDITPNLRSIT